MFFHAAFFLKKILSLTRWRIFILRWYYNMDLFLWLMLETNGVHLQVLERVFQWIVLKDHLKNNNEHISSSESVKYGDQFIIWYSFPIHCSIFFKKFSNVSFLVSILTAKTKRSIFYINQERPFCPSLFL